MIINQNQGNILAICLNKSCCFSRFIQDQDSLYIHKQHIVDCVVTKYWSQTILKEQNKVLQLLEKVQNNSSINQIEKPNLERKLSQVIENFSETEMIKFNSPPTQQQKNKIQSILLDCYNHQIENRLIGIINECSSAQKQKQILLKIINEIYSVEDMKYLALSFYQKGEILQFVGREKEAIECYKNVTKIQNSINEEKHQVKVIDPRVVDNPNNVPATYV